MTSKQIISDLVKAGGEKLSSSSLRFIIEPINDVIWITIFNEHITVWYCYDINLPAEFGQCVFHRLDITSIKDLHELFLRYSYTKTFASLFKKCLDADLQTPLKDSTFPLKYINLSTLVGMGSLV